MKLMTRTLAGLAMLCAALVAGVITAPVPLLAQSVGFFQQAGVGAVVRSIIAKLRDIPITPEDFGAKCDGTDAGPAIQLAINQAGAVGGYVQGASCAYTVVTPIVDSLGVTFRGGRTYAGTTIAFAPTSNNQIAYRVRNAGHIVFGGSIENVQFYSAETTFTKTAIEVEDVSNYQINNIVVNGTVIGTGGTAFWGGGGNSIGIRIRGREFVRINHVQAAADRPMVISDNPNSTIDSDWGHFENLYLLANGVAGKNFEIESGANFTHMEINNISCVLGAYCVYNNDTTATQKSQGLSILGVGSEQSSATTPANSGTIYIKRPAAGPLYNLHVGGFQVWDGVRNGAVLRNVIGARFANVDFNSSSSYTCIDTDNTVYGLNWSNSEFRGCVAGLSGQGLIRSESTPAGYTLQRSATYASNTESAATLANQEIFLSTGGGNHAVSASGSLASSVASIWPTVGGTVATNATAPIALNATTGAVSINAPYGSLTANNGGIVYSGATNLAILAGNVTANFPLLSGASAAPSWAGITYPTAATQGGIPWFSSTSSMATSALLAQNQIVLGGGTATPPATLGSLGTTTTLLHGNAAGAPSFGSVVSADMNITTTTCTNQFVTAISSGGVGTCTTDTLASAQHANQGTTTTVLHGNASGNPSWGAVSLTADVTGVLPSANGGFPQGAWTTFTPTVTCNSGGPPTLAAGATNGSAYLISGKTMFVRYNIIFSANNGCANYVIATIPNSKSSAGTGALSGSEYNTGAWGVNGSVNFAGSTSFIITKYDGTNPGDTNTRGFQLSGTIEIQ